MYGTIMAKRRTMHVTALLDQLLYNRPTAIKENNSINKPKATNAYPTMEVQPEQKSCELKLLHLQNSKKAILNNCNSSEHSLSRLRFE